MTSPQNDGSIFEVGDKVIIYGLHNENYNECKGIIAGKFNSTKQRYPVKLAKSTEKN